MIAPYVKDIPSMAYKTNLEINLDFKKDHIRKKHGQNVDIVISSSERNKNYSEQEIQYIIQSKNKNATNQAIADKLGRTYWSIVYKVRELRKKSLL